MLSNSTHCSLLPWHQTLCNMEGAGVQGWQATNMVGQPDLFRLARQVLPGPYTFILVAGKRLPKQVVDYLSGKSKTRRTVGVRMPADAACQAI